MKERPLPFSGPMVRATLAGAKNQTRRVAKLTANGHVKEPGGHRRWHPADPDAGLACPYGQPGDRLWVREAWKAHTTFDHLPPRDIPESHVWYMADDGYKAESRYRQGMFMPRWASRITLEVTGVRVERLQDISEADAIAEGIEEGIPASGANVRVWKNYSPSKKDTPWLVCPLNSYFSLWQSINGPGTWEVNPLVWVVEFKRI